MAVAAAVALGLVSGVLLVWLGIFGIVIAAGLAILALVSSPRLSTVTGLLIGSGIGMAAMVFVAATRCPAALGESSTGCEGPDLRVFIGIGLGLAVAGIITFAASRRRHTA